MKKRQQVHFSYGIICIRKTANEGIKYFMIRKRLTYAFMSFCYGKYDVMKPETIIALFNAMTRTEKETIIRTYDFKIIFNHLMGSNPPNNTLYINLYSRFIKAFPSQAKLNELLDKSNKSGQLVWEFPKGHKSSHNEPDINASYREFDEESGIPANAIKLFPSAKKEISHCDDQEIWKTSYCYSYLIKEVEDYKFDANEISEVGWYSKKEIMNKHMMYNPKPLLTYLDIAVLPRVKNLGLFIPQI